jgi:hypothetical protein
VGTWREEFFEAPTGRDQAAKELLVPALVGFDAGPEVPEVEEAQRLLTMREPVAKPIGG